MLPLCYFPICVSIFFLDLIYFHVAFLWFSYLCYFFSTVIRFRYVGNSYISGYLSVWIVKKSEQFLDKELHNITLRLPIAEFPGWLTEPVKKLPVRQLLVWKPWSSCLFFPVCGCVSALCKWCLRYERILLYILAVNWSVYTIRTVLPNLVRTWIPFPLTNKKAK